MITIQLEKADIINMIKGVEQRAVTGKYGRYSIQRERWNWDDEALEKLTVQELLEFYAEQVKKSKQ